MPCHDMTWHTTPYPYLPQPLPYPTLPYPTTPDHIPPYHTLPHHTRPYLTLPIISCLSVTPTPTQPNYDLPTPNPTYPATPYATLPHHSTLPWNTGHCSIAYSVLFRPIYLTVSYYIPYPPSRPRALTHPIQPCQTHFTLSYPYIAGILLYHCLCHRLHQASSHSNFPTLPVMRPWKGFWGYRDIGNIFVGMWNTFLKRYSDMEYLYNFRDIEFSNKDSGLLFWNKISSRNNSKLCSNSKSLKRT